jgi:hypothetical protein
MATRQHRLSEFNGGAPPPERPLQLLCEDHNGTYVLPYLCQWHEDEWQNCGNLHPIEATVVGWREAPPTGATPRKAP